jgi:hypothetical protein
MSIKNPGQEKSQLKILCLFLHFLSTSFPLIYILRGREGERRREREREREREKERERENRCVCINFPLSTHNPTCYIAYLAIN